eukprot:TRINITY_DN7699_c0_g1_i1.p1 TRINITY_DN7699_c0_g1~~TRINITY_DN7699_c0_g1_i1.p1  ORF type:complete len:831 (+),score=228.11 TRINITY_DN7699_c0_g1_i1:140-2494(+)
MAARSRPPAISSRKSGSPVRSHTTLGPMGDEDNATDSSQSVFTAIESKLRMLTSDIRNDVDQSLRAVLERLNALEARGETKDSRISISAQTALSHAERLNKEIKTLSSKVENIQGSVKSQGTNMDDVLARRLDDMEDRLRATIAQVQRHETWIKKEFEELRAHVRASEDARVKTEAETKLAYKEIEVITKVDMLETTKDLETKIETEAEVIRSLTQDVANKFSQMARVVDAADKRMEETTAALWHEVTGAIKTSQEEVATQLSAEASERGALSTAVTSTNEHLQKLDASIAKLSANQDSTERGLQQLIAAGEQEAARSALLANKVSAVADTAAQDKFDRIAEMQELNKRLDEQQSAFEQQVKSLQQQLTSANTTIASQAVEFKRSLHELERSNSMQQETEVQRLNDVISQQQSTIDEMVTRLASFITQVESRDKKRDTNIATLLQTAEQTQRDLSLESSTRAEMNAHISQQIDTERAARDAALQDLAEHTHQQFIDLTTVGEQTRNETLTLIKDLQQAQLNAQVALSDQLEEQTTELSLQLQDIRTALGQKDFALKEMEQRLSERIEKTDRVSAEFQEQYKIAHALLNDTRAATQKELSLRKAAETRLQETESLLQASDRALQQSKTREEQLKQESTRTRQTVVSLEAENVELKAKEWYKCRNPDDPIDVAVCKAMQGMKIPIKMEFRRLSPGMYMGDKRVTVNLLNDRVMVRRGGGWVALQRYLEDIHYPIVLAKYGPEVAAQYVTQDPGSTGYETPSVSVSLTPSSLMSPRSPRVRSPATAT